MHLIGEDAAHDFVERLWGAESGFDDAKEVLSVFKEEACGFGRVEAHQEADNLLPARFVPDEPHINGLEVAAHTHEDKEFHAAPEA